jgi:hypothetical protein
MIDQTVINLLVQIPLAGIVVFLTLRFLIHLEKMNSNLFMFLSKEAETNREFLKTQREQMNQSIGRLAEEIKSLRINIAMQSSERRRDGG